MKYIPILLTLALVSVKAEPIKVFILAGQSNMEGQGSVDHDGDGGKGNLVWSMKNSKSAEKMKKLKNEKGEWVVRDDVRISFKVGGDNPHQEHRSCQGSSPAPQRHVSIQTMSQNKS